ncbi:MAG: hypothetical protein WC325_02695 [Candidatus Bathyarchaeia archaeon]|jgi:hypothetical protein
MSTKFAVNMICLIVIGSILFSASCFADVSMGIKQGDWVEYNVTCNGPVPAEHDLTWAKMEYVSVQGKTAEVNITSRYTDGSEAWVILALDLEAGATGDSFLIPANLQKGDTYKEQYHGNITILDVEQRTYAGAKRNTVHGATTETQFYWDQQTGVLLEARSTYTDYTIDTVAQKTNIWQPETTGIDPTVLLVLLFVLIAAIIVAVAVRLKTKRK